MPPSAQQIARRAYASVVEHDTHKPDFRGRLTQLPLPGTERFSTVGGRSGDAIVIQLSSTCGMRHKHKKSLATLGLHGIDTAALVNFKAGSTIGNLAVLGPKVRVIKLKKTVEKRSKNACTIQGDRLMVEHVEYGSKSQPCDLLRVNGEDYWYSEFSKRSANIAWSTSSPARDTINALAKALDSASGTGRIIRHTEEGDELGEGSLTEVIDYLEGQDPTTIEYVQVKVGDLSLSWKEPFRRFVDSELELAEVTVVMPRRNARDHYNLVEGLISQTATKSIVAIAPLAYLQQSR